VWYAIRNGGRAKTPTMPLKEELNEHAHRLLRAICALVGYPVVKDVPGDGPALSQSIAEKSSVRLKNVHNLLPLGPAVHSVIVIGGDADKGVLVGRARHINAN